MHHCNGRIGLSFKKCMTLAILPPCLETCLHTILDIGIGSAKQIGTYLTQHHHQVMSVRFFPTTCVWPHIDIVNVSQFIRTSITANTSLAIHPPSNLFSSLHGSSYVFDVFSVLWPSYIGLLYRAVNHADNALDILLPTIKAFCN